MFAHTNRIPQSQSELLCQLEPRIVLSDTYYVWTGAEHLPGYDAEVGTPDSIVGASDSGHYFWSAAAADRSDPDVPYLVIDEEVCYLRDIPAMSDAEIAGINSDGLVLAEDAEGDDLGRIFLLDLAAPGGRIYLDEMGLQAPPEFDLGATDPIAIGDGAGMVLQSPAQEHFRQLWIVTGRIVTPLWEGRAISRPFIDMNAENAVTGLRRAQGDDVPMLWTPQRGLVDLAALGITDVGTLNNDGTLFAKIGDELVLWRDGDAEGTGIRDTVDGSGLTAYFPLSRDASGRIVYEWYGFMGAHEYELSSPEGDVSIAIWHEGRAYAPHLIESGLMLNLGSAGHAEPPPSGGWYAIVDHETLVTSIAGSDVTVWADESGATVEMLHLLRGSTRFALDRSGNLSWEPIGGHHLDSAVKRTVVYDPATDRYLVLSTEFGRLDIFGKGYNGASFPNEFRITRAPTAFFLTDTRPIIAGLNDDGHVIILWEPRVNAQYTYWSDLSEKHLEPQGLRTPDFVGGLSSFATRWNAMNIVGLDASGDVHAVWWSPARGDAGWTTSNLSDIAGAPPLVGDITATSTPWGGMQIFGTDARGHVIGLWWAPGAGGWHAADLTAETDGLLMRSDSLTVRLMPGSGISLVGKSAEDEVAAYWWTPRTGWVSESISDRLGDAAPTIPGLVSYQTTRSGNQHISGVNAEGDVVHVWWRPDGTNLWRVENLTERALG